LAAIFLAPSDWLIGAADTDLSQQFLSWRAFAAASLRAGHLPLWNSYTYSGEPFLAGFQSAVFYPPNLVFLVLPLCRAVNLSCLFHLLVLGAGMHSLAAGRGLDRRAAFVAGYLLPLSGPVFPHLYAGHLSNLSSMAWTPWILAGCEDWQRRKNARSLLFASAAVAAQILAGQVQYVFYTAVAAGLQSVVASLAQPSARWRALPGVGAVYAVGGFLAAAQLFPGLASAAENLRHAKLDYGFVSIFGFPIENLFTAAAPGFFGTLRNHIYWGRDYLWEMSFFAGVSGLVLAAVAAVDSKRRHSAWLDLGLAGFFLLLAFGSQTPLFHILYHHVPGFDRFRGLSKFTFPAMIYFVLAIAGGADALIARRQPPKALAAWCLLAGFAALGAGMVIHDNPELIAGLLVLVQRSRESFLPAAAFVDSGFVRAAGVQAGWSLLQSGIVFSLAAACLITARQRPAWRWALFPLLGLEMAGFTYTHFGSFREWQAMPNVLRNFAATHPGDYRVLDTVALNNGFLLGAPDIWGNDPGLPSRYAEFIGFTQGINPDQATQIVPFRDIPPIYSMLRLRYVFQRSAAEVKWTEYGGALPHIQLVSDYRVLAGRDALFAALAAPGFDPNRTVLLENEPEPQPDRRGDPGAVRLLETAPDFLTIEAALNRPALLLITDPFSRDWRARPVLESDLRTYRLMPADYILRAIPLGPGHHLLRVEYIPAWFHAGVVVSVVAWLLWILLAIRLPGRIRLETAHGWHGAAESTESATAKDPDGT
jgi:hypothetical protein